MKKDSTKVKIGKLLGGYGFGLFLNQSVNLLVLPILWRVLSPEDFGIIATTQIVTLVLIPVYMFGMQETIQRFYYRWSEESRPHHLGWLFWFIFAFTLILTLILDFFGKDLSGYLVSQVDFDPLIRYTLWSVFFNNFIFFPIALSRIKQKVLSYNIVTNGSFLTQIAIIYYFVIVQKQGATGYVKGVLLSNILWFFPIIFITFRDCAIFPAKKYIRIPLDYSLPLTFSGVIDGISSVLDRFFLDKYIPLSTMGFYNLARQIGSSINAINIVTKTILHPYLYKAHAFKKDMAQILSSLGLIYTVLMTVPVIAVQALSPDIIHLLDPSGVYIRITEYIPYFVISVYIGTLSSIHGRGMDLEGKSFWNFLIPLVSTLASLGIYIYAMPIYGVYGALIGLIINGLIRTLINNYLAYYYLPRRYYFNKILISWAVTAVFFFLVTELSIPNVWISIICKSAIVVLFLGIQAGLIIKKELLELYHSTAKG